MAAIPKGNNQSVRFPNFQKSPTCTFSKCGRHPNFPKYQISQLSKMSDFPTFQNVTDSNLLQCHPNFPKRHRFQTQNVTQTCQNVTYFQLSPPSCHRFPTFPTVTDLPSKLWWRCTVTGVSLTSASRSRSIQRAQQTLLLLPSPQLILQLIIGVQLSSLLQLGHLSLFTALAPCLQFGCQGLLGFGLLFCHVVLLKQSI